ncbi:MAG: hypothetical protein ACKVHE_31695, partial [Planctomycetales bacterium]
DVDCEQCWMISSVLNRQRGIACFLRRDQNQSIQLWNWSRLRGQVMAQRVIRTITGKEIHYWW